MKMTEAELLEKLAPLRKKLFDVRAKRRRSRSSTRSR